MDRRAKRRSTLRAAQSADYMLCAQHMHEELLLLYIVAYLHGYGA